MKEFNNSLDLFCLKKENFFGRDPENEKHFAKICQTKPLCLDGIKALNLS
jgi:hypothetical protein